MKISPPTVEAYFAQLPADRQAAIGQLRQTIRHHLPEGFEETISYDMISYVVPLARYPSGYHCDPKQPLPFVSIASQKNFIALYHFGLYASPVLTAWFAAEYPKHVTTKLDMGKSCIRFKKPEKIPHLLIGELLTKISLSDWINLYETNLKAVKK